MAVLRVPFDNPDGRQGYVIILRACQAGDGEAHAARLPYDLTERVTERILAGYSADQTRGVRPDPELSLFIFGVSAQEVAQEIVMLHFTKMHGIGNDYIYINGFEETLPDDLAALARQNEPAPVRPWAATA